MVLLRTVPLPSRMPLGLGVPSGVAVFMETPHFLLIETISAKVPRADLVSRGGSQLPWWSVLTLGRHGTDVTHENFCPMLFAWFEADLISLKMILKANSHKVP